jgi:hypothetical protein
MVHFRQHQTKTYDTPSITQFDGNVWRDGSKMVLNYAYGHPELSLLLFTYSPVINYINHNASGFNAKLRWSTLSSHRGDWLERTPDELESERHAYF